MLIRQATEDDLSRIIELGKEFGHQMYYQKDPDLMKVFLRGIIVAEESEEDYRMGGLGETKRVVGYYHYVSDDFPGWKELMRCYKQIPESKVEDAGRISGYGSFACLMQGASHRDVFKKLIQYLQTKYSTLWCYCSVKSARPKTYEDLGFVFNHRYTFFNINKGDFSTYRLGEWTRIQCSSCKVVIKPEDSDLVTFIEDDSIICGRCQSGPH